MEKSYDIDNSGRGTDLVRQEYLTANASSLNTIEEIERAKIATEAYFEKYPNDKLKNERLLSIEARRLQLEERK